jgi:hypothetical protein
MLRSYADRENRMALSSLPFAICRVFSAYLLFPLEPVL